MVGSLRDLFLHPSVFFEQVSQEKAGFIWPFIIVFLGSIISFIGAVALSPQVTDPLTQYSITFLFLSGVAIFTWVIISAGLFLLSRAFSGTGSFLATLRNTGYGMLPFAFSNAVTFATVLAITGNVASLSTVNPGVFSALIYVEQAFFTVWAAYLWFCGLRRAHGIPAPLAAAAVVIVIALALAIFFLLTTMSLP